MCFVWMSLHSDFLIKIKICQMSHLFVGEDEQQSISELFLRQQFGQFTVRLHQPVSVTAVNHKHHRWETTDGRFQSYSHHSVIMLTITVCFHHEQSHTLVNCYLVCSDSSVSIVGGVCVCHPHPK